MVRQRTLLTIAVLLLCTGCGQTQGAGFTLTSPAFQAESSLRTEQVLNGFGCSGTNVSPELHWSGAPGGTKSYAITLYDPDAPTGSGWWHWIVYNIPATVTSLPAGAGDPATALLPHGAAQGTTDFGQARYGGPCPPQGDKAHRYIFTIHALDTEKLDLPATATAAFIGFNLSGHTLAKTTVTTHYSR